MFELFFNSPSKTNEKESPPNSPIKSPRISHSHYAGLGGGGGFKNWKEELLEVSRGTLCIWLVQKVPAMAAGKLFRRWNYLWLQAEISAGNDCLRFLQVLGRNILLAPELNLLEALNERFKMDSSKLGTFLFIWSHANWPTEALAAFEVKDKTLKSDSYPIKLTCSLLVVHTVFQKRNKKVSGKCSSLWPIWSKTDCRYSFTFSHLWSEWKLSAKTKICLKVPCFLGDMDLCRIWKKFIVKQIKRRKRCILSGKIFSKISQFVFPDKWWANNDGSW